MIEIKTVETKGEGFLSFFEEINDIPFSIKRIYYIYKVPSGILRGGHAHKSLNQILFCPYGNIEIFLDNGYEKNSVILDSPDKGLVIFGPVWREMLWHTEGSVLCVAASDFYCETDYIRDYDEYIKYITKLG
jgi:dTDP-4-dehydrorhamnose 3,5-epimerase-like enzyme